MRELGPDGEYTLDIALAGSDLQQRHDLSVGLTKRPQRQVSEFQYFLDPHPCVAQDFDDGPGPERPILGLAQINTPPVSVDRGDVVLGKRAPAAIRSGTLAPLLVCHHER